MIKLNLLSKEISNTFSYLQMPLESYGTFGDLKKSCSAYNQNGSKIVKNYDNMVEPCLLDEPDEKHIIDTLPPPELHILMKIITALALLLRQFYE